MAGLPITLFVDAFFSTRFDFRCFVALEEKGLEFAVSRAMVSEGMGLSAAYRELSVTGRVPGMAHGDFWVAESLAIVEYLEETFPAPAWPRLWPEDPRRRARARQVVSFLGSDHLLLAEERPSWMVSYPASPPPLSARARAEADELIELALRVHAEGVLDEWSLAAADLTFALLRLARTGEALPEPLTALIEANLARPSVKRYLGHERPPNPPLTGRRAVT